MITKVSIIGVIQKHLELPDNIMDKLAQELYDHLGAGLPEKSPKDRGLSTKDLEELLAAVSKLKDIHSSIEPKYIEDQLYEDQLKQLENKLTEILFENT